MGIQILDNGFVFVPHQDWSKRPLGGRGRRGAPVRQVKGVRDVFIHHSVTIAQGDPSKQHLLDPSDDPCKDARKIEDILNSRNLLPGYSYLVHPSGVVLEMAGAYIGAHTADWNSKSKGICFIGNLETHQVMPTAIVGAARTIGLLMFGGDLVGNLDSLRIRGHGAVGKTACPGKYLKVHLGELREAVKDGR